jgi:putative ABC transport system permease protein
VIRESVLQALRTLRAEGWRTGLTLFGIVWGTAAVVFLMGWGEGLRLTFDDGFTRSGRNMAVVWAGAISEEFTPAADRRHLWYELEDVEALRRRARLPDLVGGEARRWGAVAYRQKSLSYDVRGIEPEVLGLRGARVARGRALSRSDVDLRKRVAVIGAEVREQLFGAEGRVGSRIRINGTPFEVVGVLEPVGTQLSYDGSPTDEQVWIPITTHAALWPKFWTDAVVADRILFRVPDRRVYDAAVREVRAILAERLRVGPRTTRRSASSARSRCCARSPSMRARG